ncbi:MAG: glycosyltransferase family 9 protein [Bacteroidia bacterium]|nr:glycosyltransferase family 9 protein [Bacteroidia bacterium]
MDQSAKFLIIRFSSIGDIVLTTPVVRCLKTQVEGAIVHYLTKPQFAEILASNPYIDKIHTLKKNFNETLEELENECFDYVIDLHHNIRSARVVSNLKLGAFKFRKLNIEKWLLVNFRINRLPDKHIVDRYIETVAPFDVHNDGQGLDYFIPAKDGVDIKYEFGDPFTRGYIAFVIGAKHFTKQLPAEKIASICHKTGLPVIMLGGKEDMEKGEAIKKKVESIKFKEKNEHQTLAPSKVEVSNIKLDTIINACGKFNLNQSASLVKQAKTVITHDTGLMHTAAAFRKKIISIWGNTIPAFGMYPYKSDRDSEIVEVKNLKCRPCTKIGFKECPKNHFRCMVDIDENRIVELAQKFFVMEAIEWDSKT